MKDTLLKHTAFNYRLCIKENEVGRNMTSNTRLWGKRRFAGLLIILAISVSLVGLSVAMFAQFAHSPHEQPKVKVAPAPARTSTIAPITGTTPIVNATPSLSNPAIATSTATPATTVTPTDGSTPLPLGPTPALVSPTPRSTIVASPLLYGTNLVLFGANDPILASPTNQSLLEQIHTSIIRMPIRTGVPEAVDVQAAQTIKNMGAVPDVILSITQNAQSQANNI